MKRNFCLIALVFGAYTGSVMANMSVSCPDPDTVSKVLAKHRESWLNKCPDGSSIQFLQQGIGWRALSSAPRSKSICEQVLNPNSLVLYASPSAGGYAIVAKSHSGETYRTMGCYYKAKDSNTYVTLSSSIKEGGFAASFGPAWVLRNSDKSMICKTPEASKCAIEVGNT